METKKQPPKVLTDTVIRAIVVIGYCEEINVYDISREVGITYSHTIKKILPKLASWDVVTHQRKGRQRMVSMTPRGREIFKRLQEIGELLGEPMIIEGDRNIDLFIASLGEVK